MVLSCVFTTQIAVKRTKKSVAGISRHTLEQQNAGLIQEENVRVLAVIFLPNSADSRICNEIATINLSVRKSIGQRFLY